MAATALASFSAPDRDYDDTEAKSFETERAELRRRYGDAPRDDPSSLASSWARHVLDSDPDAIDVDAMADALRDDAASFRLRDAAARVRQRLRASRLEIYVAGNVDDDAALAYATTARRAFPPQDQDQDDAPPGGTTPPGTTPPEGSERRRRVDQTLKLPRGDAGVALELRALRRTDAPVTAFVGDVASTPPLGGDAEHAESDPNNAVEVLWQLGKSGDDDDASDNGWRAAADRDAAATLLGHLAAPSAFNQLRTVEQLGYVVDAGLDATYGVLALRCLVQSATGLDPPALEDRVQSWVDAFSLELDALDDDDFQNKRDGLATELEQRPASLRDVVGRDWHEISSKRRRFSHVRARATSVRRVTKQDLLKLLEDHVATGAPRKRVLRSRVYAPKAADDRARRRDADADPSGATLITSKADLKTIKQRTPTWGPPVTWDEGPHPDDPAT